MGFRVQAGLVVGFRVGFRVSYCGLEEGAYEGLGYHNGSYVWALPISQKSYMSGVP